MKGARRRIWAFAIVLAMLCSLIPAIPARAADGVLQVSWAWENQGTPCFCGNYEQYEFGIGISIGNTAILSLAYVDGINLSEASDFSKLSLKDDQDNPVSAEIGYVTNEHQVWNQQAQEWQIQRYASGVYGVEIYKTGTYRLYYDDGTPNNYVTVEVELPEIGVYTSKTASDETLLVMHDGDMVDAEPGKTYYLVAREDLKTRDDLVALWINFCKELGKENLDWTQGEKAFETIEFTVPKTMVGEWRDAITCDYTRTGQPEGSEPDRFHISFPEYRQGLMIAETKRNWDDTYRADRNYALDPTGSEGDDLYFNHFRKAWGDQVLWRDEVTLGFCQGDTIRVLDKDDLGKLRLLDENGDEVSVEDARISLGWFYYYDEEAKQDVQKDIDDVFSLLFNRTGVFYLEYADGGETSLIRIDVEEPDWAIYGKPVPTADYLVGGDRTEYNDERRTFYIIRLNRTKTDWEKTFTINGVSADVQDASVVVDKENGVIKVTIAPDADGDINVQVRFRVDEYWYDRNEDGTRGRKNNENHWDEDRWFSFTPGEELRPYSEAGTADIEAADAVTALVTSLPITGRLTQANEATVVEARTKYQALTTVQKLLVDADVLDRLAAAEERIAARKAEAQAVVDLIAALKADTKITVSDKDAVDKAEAAYNALGTQEKTWVSAESVAKLNAAKDALQKAIVKQSVDAAVKVAKEAAAKTAEAAQKKALEEAAKKAAADQKAAVAAAEKKAKESMSPALKTILYDAKSKSLYKVTKKATLTSTGTVEYVSPYSPVAKITIQPTITFNGFKYNVVTIGASAFRGITKLTTLTINAKITSIGANACNGCTKLNNLTIKSTALKKVGAKALKGMKKGKIVVPSSKKAAYTKLFNGKGQAKAVKVTTK